MDDLPDIGARRDSVLRSLHLLFNEGYHGSNPQDPVRPFLCEDALRLTELLLDAKATAHPDVHALAALFCFDAARLPARLDEHGVFVPLEDQDRSGWDRARIERGLMHLARSATGAGEPKLSRYPFYWAARADLERRAGCTAAREYYEHAIALARSPAERASFERRIESRGIS